MENLILERNKKVKFYWLIPIIEKEVSYKEKFGAEALEIKFEDATFNYLDPKRPGMV